LRTDLIISIPNFAAISLAFSSMKGDIMISLDALIPLELS
jgi:hypothetical protein